MTLEEIKHELAVPTDKRVFAIAQALHDNSLSIDEIHDLSKIDYWFLYKCERMVNTWKKLEQVTGIDSLSRELLLEAKKMGYSDLQIAEAVQGSSTEDDVRAHRLQHKVTPVTKQID